MFFGAYIFFNWRLETYFIDFRYTYYKRNSKSTRLLIYWKTAKNKKYVVYKLSNVYCIHSNVYYILENSK